jgi:predicted P-loop ATPase
MVKESNVILRNKRQKSKNDEREREQEAEENPGQQLTKKFSLEDIHREEFKDYSKKELAKKVEKTKKKLTNEFANDEKMVSLILIHDELA